jgi:hypothetical protein
MRRVFVGFKREQVCSALVTIDAAGILQQIRASCNPMPAGAAERRAQ